MDSFQIRSGPAEVIGSGTVITFDGNPVEIEFGVPEDRLKLIVRFDQDSEKKEPRTEVKYIDGKTAELILVNYDNPLGTGSSKPLKMGAHGQSGLCGAGGERASVAGLAGAGARRGL